MSGRRSEPGTYQSADLTDPVFALCPVRAPLVSVEGYTTHAIHLLPQLGVLDGKTIAANNRSDADEVLLRRSVYPAIYHAHAPLSITPAAAAPLAILTLTTLTLKVLLRRSQRLGGWVHAIKEESAAAVRQHEAARQVSAASL